MTAMDVKQRLLREGIEEGVINETLTMLKENRNPEIVLQAAQTLDEYQMYQLRLAWKDGRTDEQVKWLASTNLNEHQMDELRIVWKDGRTDGQVAWLASTNLTWEQMQQLSWAWKDGRTDEQVEWLASTNLDMDQMEQLRKAWQDGRTEEQIKWLASTNSPWDKMEQQREAWKAEDVVSTTPPSSAQPTNGTMRTMNSFGSTRPHTDSFDARPYMEKGSIGYQLQVESPEEEVIQYALQNTINDATARHDQKVSSTGLLNIVMQVIHIYLVVTLFVFIIFYTTLPTKVFSLLLATSAALNLINGYLTTKFEAEAPHGKLFELCSVKYFICAYIIMLATKLAVIPVLIVLAGELFVLGIRHVEVEGQPLLHVNQFFEGAVASVLCLALLLLLNGVSTLLINGIVLVTGVLNSVCIIRKVASNYANFKKAFVHN